MNDSEDERERELRSFGRRKGRKPSPRQSALLADLLPRVAVYLARPAPADVRAVFGATAAGLCEVWLEIGFGGAEHMIWQAGHHPNVGMIGCEPFEDGVVKALSAIAEQGLGNVRLHADDARPLLRWLPDACIGRVFILYPDPWPKTRHAKRRLVQPALLGELARVMRPGAELRIGTDIGDYARTVLLAMRDEPRFAWTARGPADWRVRPDDWPITRYEQKAVREGRRSTYLRFVRL